jgi:hypothetical protein
MERVIRRKGSDSVMAKYRMVRTDFWKNPIVSEEMTPEDKYFYLYLLTNPATTQIGIYKITKNKSPLIWAIRLRVFIP